MKPAFFHWTTSSLQPLIFTDQALWPVLNTLYICQLLGWEIGRQQDLYLYNATQSTWTHVSIPRAVLEYTSTSGAGSYASQVVTQPVPLHRIKYFWLYSNIRYTEDKTWMGKLSLYLSTTPCRRIGGVDITLHTFYTSSGQVQPLCGLPLLWSTSFLSNGYRDLPLGN